MEGKKQEFMFQTHTSALLQVLKASPTRPGVLGSRNVCRVLTMREDDGLVFTLDGITILPRQDVDLPLIHSKLANVCLFAEQRRTTIKHNILCLDDAQQQMKRIFE